MWALTTCGFAGYFALAIYFDRTHVDLRPGGGWAIRPHPSTHEKRALPWVSRLRLGERTRLVQIAADDPRKEKNVILYDLGLRRSNATWSRTQYIFRLLENWGRGHFAHWSESGIYFSTSDNTDPSKINGRRYWAVEPYQLPWRRHFVQAARTAPHKPEAANRYRRPRVRGARHRVFLL